MNSNPTDLTLHEWSDLIQKREVSSTDVVRSLLARIQEKESKIHAYIRFDEKAALEKAGHLDNIPTESRKGILWGLPISNKDIICVKGVETTCASKILSGYIPPYNATVVEKLNGAGAILFGNTNMDEFAMGSSTETSAYGVTRNPWDLERIPGGSSGGSAAAVAAGEAIAALGTDTGGSIRQPAALSGCVGLKPTYGRVSRYGLIAFASSLDQIGPITQDVEDTALILQVIAGHDPKDSTSLDIPVPDYRSTMKKGVKGLKIGLPKEYFIEGMDVEVKQSIDDAVKVLSGLGAEFVSCQLPHTNYAVATYYILATAQASSNLARYDGVQYGFRAKQFSSLVDLYFQTRGEGFGEEVKRRIILGTYALSSGYYDAYYLKAQKVRTLIKNDFDKVFDHCDAVLTPTSPSCAFKIGEKMNDPLKMYLSDIFTISANLAGIPGISIPCGFSKEGLPIGLQILGKHFDEATILKVAYAFEQATEFHKKRPDVRRAEGSKL
ncbi:MAG: Asp-tRNA(Asn)/Glu-tRNA(Gln) amidotransferase subunit GatA [Chlamydiae bacterium]|nr:Asp-tRNA(Asn)/Glu-tRNA(Gln) amidotransferase subunit GatA [Chlamydiota bacterium]MBI3277197.1 Asp-tRNA(Asn)/Glu-tRNA(Gln) amidotransferase subunit GatA [Chlamydiota bacterium]